MIRNPEALMAQAVEASGGLSDYGADGWQEGLEQLLAAVSRDLGDDPGIVAPIERMVVGRLANRLRIEAWYSDHGAEAEHPVRGPVVIIGLPRTATTALHHVLALDPQFRYPRNWEMATPVPPPEAGAEESDPRRPSRSGPASVQHISTVDGPTEDGSIHALDFHHQEAALPVPTYTAWWRTADHKTTFAYQERVLRLLHSHRPPYRWVLKAPAYLFHLPELAAQYPHARFIMTHRDPTQAIPSACSVILDARKRVLPGWSPDETALGIEVLKHFAAGMCQTIEARLSIGESRFLDISQYELENDAGETARQIYAFLELDLTDAVLSRVGAWSVENRRGSRGEHRYTAEQFGLTQQIIAEQFGEYQNHFAECLVS